MIFMGNNNSTGFKGKWIVVNLAIALAVVVVLLAIALIVVNAAGIRIHKPAPETPVETNLPQFPFFPTYHLVHYPAG